MSVQETFNKVIEHEIYDENLPLMCYALREANKLGVISDSEYSLAQAEILGYLKGFGSLGGLLNHKNLDYKFEARLAIYKDWANKPKY